MTYVRQPEPLGLGHAVLMASHNIHPKEYFGVMLQMISSWAQRLPCTTCNHCCTRKASVIAVQEVPTDASAPMGS